MTERENLKQYLITNGFSIQGNRIDICPSCGKAGSAQINENGTVRCYKIGCKINHRGVVDIATLMNITNLPPVSTSKVYMSKSPVRKVYNPPTSLNNEDMNDWIYSIATDFFHQELLKNRIAYQHLLSRGRTEESIDFFKVGLTSNTNNLVSKLNKDFSPKEICNSGLFYDSKFSQPRLFCDTDIYCYPISENGMIRNIKSKNGSEGKYIVRKFHTYNYQISLNIDALNNDEVIFVEGENDCMKLWEMGYQNTIAILGSLSNEQVRFFSDNMDNKKYLLCFDNDRAGLSYYNKFFKGLKYHQRQNVKKVIYKGSDPDKGHSFNF